MKLYSTLTLTFSNLRHMPPMRGIHCPSQPPGLGDAGSTRSELVSIETL